MSRKSYKKVYQPSVRNPRFQIEDSKILQASSIKISHKSHVNDFSGPIGWKFLHMTASTFDGRKEAKIAFRNLLYCFTILYPCPRCRKNLTQELKKIDVEQYLKTNKDLFFFTYVLHDEVNKRISRETGIPKISPPFKKVRDYWFNKLEVKCKNC